MPATYEPISNQTLSSAATSITFSSIPNTYTDLIIVVSGRTSAAGSTCGIRFNNDSTTNYSITELYGSGGGGSALSARRTNDNRIHASYAAVNFSDSNIANTIIRIMNYANTTTCKTVLSRVNSAFASYPGVAASVGLWRKTPEAITSIELLAGNNWNAGTTFSLYGIKAA